MKTPVLPFWLQPSEWDIDDDTNIVFTPHCPSQELVHNDDDDNDNSIGHSGVSYDTCARMMTKRAVCTFDENVDFGNNKIYDDDDIKEGEKRYTNIVFSLHCPSGGLVKTRPTEFIKSNDKNVDISF